jgi:hypothetical protein
VNVCSAVDEEHDLGLVAEETRLAEFQTQLRGVQRRRLRVYAFVLLLF